MATDGPNPPPCDSEVFHWGETIAIGHAASNEMERWVRAVAEKADARLDWHFTGGTANILFLGDPEARARTTEVLTEMASDLNGKLARIIPAGGPQLYRAGVSAVPEGTRAVAAYPDGTSEVI